MPNLNSFAPVLICTLNRHDHFKRCVESLSACTHAAKTDLFISLDYPLNESHWEGYNKIVSFLPSIVGFRTIKIIKRKYNLGGERNFIETQKYIFEQYDKVIITEDDNEFSPNFLEYINKGLVKYENQHNIFAICGYNFPITLPQEFKHNYYLSKTFSGWGYGIWKNRFEEFLKEFMDYNVILKRLHNTKESIKNVSSTNALLLIVRHGAILGDYAISAGLILKNMNCVFPCVTKVKNHGHDGSGINGGKIEGNNPFLSQFLDNNAAFEFSNPPSSKNIESINILIRVYKKRKNLIFFRCSTIIRYIIYKITGKSVLIVNQ